MKIALLGGTGETGVEVVRQALQKGHKVTVGVRSPEKVAPQKNLTIVKSDVFSAQSLEELFEGQDAVVSTLGFPKTEQEVTGFSTSIPIIVAAMRKKKVKRLVVTSAWFTDSPSRESSSFYQSNWKFVPGLANVLDDQNRMEDFLEKEAGQDLSWASVKPGTLSWGPSLGQQLVYRVGGQHCQTNSFIIRRADLARAILSVLVSEVKGNVAVGVKTSKAEELCEVDHFQENMTTMLEKTIGKDNIPDMGKMYMGWRAMVEVKYLVKK